MKSTVLNVTCCHDLQHIFKLNLNNVCHHGCSVFVLNAQVGVWGKNAHPAEDMVVCTVKIILPQ